MVGQSLVKARSRVCLMGQGLRRARGKITGSEQVQDFQGQGDGRTIFVDAEITKNERRETERRDRHERQKEVERETERDRKRQTQRN